jgi:hypothetical protein
MTIYVLKRILDLTAFVSLRFLKSLLLVVRRNAPHEMLRLNHEVSGYMFSTIITLILALNLAIVAMYGYPFSGDVHVSSLPFENFRAKHLNEVTTEPK